MITRANIILTFLSALYVITTFSFSCLVLNIGKPGILNTQTVNSDTLQFTLSRNKTVLPVSAGTSRPLKLILDTGMPIDGILIYNPDLIDSIKLINPIEVTIPGAGKDKPSTGLMSDSMSFYAGDVEFKNKKIVVLTNDIYKGFPTDGVIGYSVFGYFTTEINYDDFTIVLHNPDNFKADSTWEAVPIEFKENNIPWINVSVAVGNEEPVLMSVYIDYASSEAVEMLISPRMKYKLPEQTTDYYLGRGLSGDIYGKKGKIAKVIIGKYELNNISGAFAPAEVRSKQKDADGIIGNDFLRRFNVIFDYANKMLYIKPNKHFNDPFE